MSIVIIAAVARNGVIGVEGGLPWRIPEDMARFKELTMGDVLIMGRATFESIGRPLPGRTNVVLTRREGWEPEGVTVASSLDEALALEDARDRDVYIAGGAEVYRAALSFADRMELTEVDDEPEGDTYFPSVDWTEWVEVFRDDRGRLSFVTYERT